MVDVSELRFVPADYRVRLFLSVDLSGSTAYKNSESGEQRHQNSAPQWVTVFQQFYADFPALFGTEFQKQTNNGVGRDRCPKLWKAVGDELVFCGVISNQKSCIVARNAFIGTLHIYRKKLQDDGVDLNVKGAGWLAAFPEPNRTVRLRQVNGEPDLLSASEALEASADASPFDYDFLGKAIDTGFRVAGNAKPEKFVLSVQLARLIASTGPELGFGFPIRVDRPEVLKGVNKNEPYPVLYIDTMQHLPTMQTKTLEREVLGDGGPPTPARLVEYLEAYCTVVGTDEIMLKVDAAAQDIEVPESYSQHKEMIAQHLSSEQGREFDGENGEDTADFGEVEILEGVTLEPLFGEPDQ